MGHPLKMNMHLHFINISVIRGVLCSLASFCLLLSVSGESEQAPVSYWQGPDAQDAIHFCQIALDGDKGAICLVQADGRQVYEGWLSRGPVEGTWAFEMERSEGLPVSAWWNTTYRIYQIAPKLAVEVNADNRLEIGAGGTPVMELAHEGRVLRLPRIARQYELVLPRSPFEESAYGLDFEDPSFAGLASVMEEALLWELAGHREALLQRNREQPSIADRSVTVHSELQLMCLESDRCSALIVSRMQRRGSGTSVELETAHFQRQGDCWIAADALSGVVDSVGLREGLRTMLNSVGADGDYFARIYPDPLSADARGAFSVLRLRTYLWFVFEPYVVASGAMGTICVPLRIDTSR